MAKIILQNFLRMNPENPEYSTRNQHYLISGSDPNFYLTTPPTAQEQVSAPLMANAEFSVAGYAVTGTYVNHMITSNSSLYDVILITDVGHFFGVPQYGFPIDMSNVNNHLSSPTDFINIYNQKLYFSSAGSGTMFSKVITNTPNGINSEFGFNAAVSVTRPIVNFLELMVFPDVFLAGAAANKVMSSLYKINLGNLASPALCFDLGTGFNVTHLVNYNNRYVAIGAVRLSDTTITDSFTYASNSKDYFIFLWDGIAAKYNVAIKVPGAIVDMISIGDRCYLIVRERTNQFVLYKISGNGLKRLMPIAIDSVKVGTGGISNRQGATLFEHMGMVGVNLLTKGQYMYSEDRGKFILSSVNNDLIIGVGSSALLYRSFRAGIYPYGVNSFPASITYKSQWIPVKNLSSIKVTYATPPTIAGENISVFLDGFDEDGNNTGQIALNPITSTAYDTSHKTVLDCKGFTGDRCRVTLTTISQSTWQPIIRRIELIQED